MNFTHQPRLRHRQTVWIGALFVIALVSAGCGLDMSQLVAPPTPTFTPTPSPTPSPSPTPTPAGSTAAATPVPTPQVTIPSGFTAVPDERLGYSFAVPRGWTELDLRSSQFQNMAGMFGMGDQMGALNEFLNSPEGEMLGKIYITDLSAAMFGGLPTALVVTVVDAPGYTPETATALVEGLIEANAGALGDVDIETVEPATINNLPAVRGIATANLASVGMNATVFAKVASLLANEQIYVLMLVAPADQRGAKEPVFDQIIGTFRPE
jgi:hypothetical protein